MLSWGRPPIRSGSKAHRAVTVIGLRARAPGGLAPVKELVRLTYINRRSVAQRVSSYRFDS